MSTPNLNQKVFQFPEVAVVEASAGSGKTYALAKRYLQLLLNPELHQDNIPIRNILAITFTNKAAFEMKSRILEFLKTLALETMPGYQHDNILKPLHINEKDAARRAYGIMEELIHNYNFFQVQTIDKFINALLSGCAFKIGLTANFRIRTNAREYLEYSLAQLIDRAPNDEKVMGLFRNFLDHYLYLENRSGWFPKQDVLDIMSALYVEHNHYGREFIKSDIGAEGIFKRKREILQELKQLSSVLPEGTDQRFAKSLDQFLRKHSGGFDVDSLSDYLARDEFPARKNVQVSSEVGKIWKQVHRKIRGLCMEEALSLFNSYIHIFDHVRLGFLEKSAKDDVLFLEELNKKAGLLFDDDHVTVEELYYRLATRYRHYLMDEFQDTSRLQWKNVEEMVREALSTGGSLFYVGDRKQAIYGFRGGDVELFDEVKSEFTDYNVHVDVLTTNWRSEKAVVQFNNAIFHVDNLRRFLREKEAYEREKSSKGQVIFSEDDFATLESVYGKAHQICRTGHEEGYVRVEQIEAERKEERDEIIREKLIQLIKDLRTRFAYKDIAILSRGNFEIEQMTGWLLEAGIPVDSERTSNIKSHPLMAELTSFLRFLDSPIDNIAFAEFITGTLFSHASGLKIEQMHEFIFSQRVHLTKEKDFYLYTVFRRDFPKEWETLIEEFFNNVGLYPLYELVVSFFDRYNCLKAFPGAQGFFMHFLELIKTNEEDHADISAFLEHFDGLLGEGLYVNVTDQDTVRMMTVHKAKGLEFPVVILPTLGMDVQVGKSSSNQQQSYVLQHQDEGMRLLRLKQKYYQFSDDLYAVYADEYKKAFLSELNNIYVAMTRPQKELYVFISTKNGKTFNLVNFLIPESLRQSGRQVDYAPHKIKSRELMRIPASPYYDWIGFLKKEFSSGETGMFYKEREQGRIIHFILSRIKNADAENAKTIIAEAIEEAKSQFSSVVEWDTFHDKVRQIVNAPDLKQFFQDDTVATEKDIVTADGHTRRVDRLIIKNDEVWVVDYKSTRENQKIYREQLQEYVRIVRELYPRHRVKAWLVYLDELIAEGVM